MTMTEVQCAACGKTLQIPADLAEFSCIYCGHRMKRSLQEQPQAYDGQAALQFVKDHIMDCVAGKRDMREQVTQERYDAAFRDYEAFCAPIFRQLELACQWSESSLEETVTYFLDRLEDHWAKEPTAQKRKYAQEEDKIIIAIFLVPAARHLKLSISEEFCKSLWEHWMERYPKSPFNIGSYEGVSEGFKKKFLGLCFITTAVCRQEGKPDDCAELTAFRRFRDGYLAACPDGPALIAEYYETAPLIVTLLDHCTDPAESYGEIRRRWLDGCYADLQAGRYADCKARYTEMMRTLQARYLS